MDKNVKKKSIYSTTNPIMPDEPDCVHLTERYKCNLLQVKHCLGHMCTFCQTAYERGKAHKKWLDAMNAMSEENQLRIASVYYSGRMPWKNADS